ncbi:MAG: roadblock/LC7 domain-containing protein [Gemmatimonadales bacterium]|nr:roadblock/LC7 domain-containing protein [Gemmatimonadales bacterium]
MPTTLPEVLQALAAREGVRAAVLLSADGLPIAQAGRDPVDPDTLAALCATFAQQGHRLGLAAERGGLRTAVLEFHDGLAVVALPSEETVLLVLAPADADVGELLYDLRHQRPALAALL